MMPQMSLLTQLLSGESRRVFAARRPLQHVSRVRLLETLSESKTQASSEVGKFHWVRMRIMLLISAVPDQRHVLVGGLCLLEGKHRWQTLGLWGIHFCSPEHNMFIMPTKCLLA